MHVALLSNSAIGYSSQNYRQNESIPLLVNKVSSERSQLQYAYYGLPFVCPPSGRQPPGSPFGSGHNIPLNLGEILRGDRIMTSDFVINMNQDLECRRLCEQTVSRRDVRLAQQLIDDGYVVEWILDNLPGATSFLSLDRSTRYYSAGFKLGDKQLDLVSGKMRHVLNNHFSLVIRWRDAPENAGAEDGRVIVAFEVYAKSVADAGRGPNGCLPASNNHEGLQLYITPNNTELAQKYPGSSYIPDEDIHMDDGATLNIVYTYSVYFRKDESIDWSRRWDLYFRGGDGDMATHWLAILNSLLIFGLLSGIILAVVGRARQGVSRVQWENSLEEEARWSGSRGQGGEKRTPAAGLLDNKDEADDAGIDASLEDENLDDLTGWKLLQGDVFRPPAYIGLFAPLVGSGLQLLFVAASLVFLGCLGLFKPSFRGGLASVAVGLFVFAGLFSGFYSARVYKTSGGQNWRKNTLLVRTSFFWSVCYMLKSLHISPVRC